MHKYRLISKKGEGTFSEVLKAQSIKTGKYVAIKCMKNHYDNLDQVNSLREIQALKRLSPHPNIVQLIEVLFDEPTGRLAMVFELMDMNMYDAIKGRRHYLPENRVKYYMYQLLKSIDHMHRNGIFHRDVKPENILIKDDLVKLADFGSCRGIYSAQPCTEYISTRWYRAPECLMTDGYYSYKMDMWGVGCVIYEMLTFVPLFSGNDEYDQVIRIHNVIGSTPKDLIEKYKKQSSHMELKFPEVPGTGLGTLMPKDQYSGDAVDLITKLLKHHPEDRLSASKALDHPWFKELREQDKILSQQQNQGSRRNHNLNDSVSHYSRQSEDFNGVQGGANTVQNNPSVPLDSINRSKNGSNMNVNVAMNSGKPENQKPVKPTKKLPDLKMTGHAIDGGNSIMKTQNSEMDEQASIGSLPKIKGGGTMQLTSGIDQFIKAGKTSIKSTNKSHIAQAQHSQSVAAGMSHGQQQQHYNSGGNLANSNALNQSPSQTYFKDNIIGGAINLVADGHSQHRQNNNISKKVLPNVNKNGQVVVGGQQMIAGNAQGSTNNHPLQKKSTNYVSPYSQKKQ